MHTVFRFRPHVPLAMLALGVALAAASSATDPAAAQVPCTCRAAGTSFALEACTCLATPKGPRIACCGKVLNNTAWRFTDESCPLAAAPAAVPAGRTPGGRTATGRTPLDRTAIVQSAALPHSPWRAAAD